VYVEVGCLVFVWLKFNLIVDEVVIDVFYWVL